MTWMRQLGFIRDDFYEFPLVGPEGLIATIPLDIPLGHLGDWLMRMAENAESPAQSRAWDQYGNQLKQMATIMRYGRKGMMQEEALDTLVDVSRLTAPPHIIISEVIPLLDDPVLQGGLRLCADSDYRKHMQKSLQYPEEALFCQIVNERGISLLREALAHGATVSQPQNRPGRVLN